MKKISTFFASFLTLTLLIIGMKNANAQCPVVGTSKTDVTCNGSNNGTATANPTGGTGAYTYVWSTVPAQTTQTATGLAPGNYTVFVSVPSCGSPVAAVINIAQPTTLNASITAPTNVACFGANTGSATVSASGGIAGYTYSWSPSGGTGATASGLIAGTYVVTVTDANLCTKTTSVVISQPVSALSASISSSTNILCNGASTGSATVSAAGGTGAYSYSWSPSGGIGATASGLLAGTYTVTITDANMCTTTTSVNITQPTALSASISASTNVSCFGGSNGSATVSASDGTAGYTYLWDDGSAQTTATATGLVAGSYVVIVTDANMCSTTTSVTISQPAAALSASLSASTNVACFGNSTGSATVTASNGTAGYTYLWNDGAAQTTAIASGLLAGSYIVTVTDANMCTTTTSVTISQPAAALSASISASTNVACFGNSTGSATVTASNGTSGYTYLWNDGAAQTTATASGLTAGSYIVTVTDANMCSTTTSVTISQPLAALSASISASTNVACFGNNTGSATVSVSGGTAAYTYLWNDGAAQTTASATGLIAGTYEVIVTDANMCSTTTSITITQPVAALSATISSSTNVACFGNSTGSATVSVTGGTTGYTYSWSPTGGTGATASSLPAGAYVVTVTDANFCSTTTSVSITEPAIGLSVISTNNSPIYAGASATFSSLPSGGTAPYVYSWASGVNMVNNTLQNPTITSSAVVDNGIYTITVTDANLCTATSTVSLIVYGTNLYVNDNALTGDIYTTAVGNNANAGTPSAPFATINQAIAIAQPGNTIYVDAGTYSEDVTISKQLTLTGAGHAVTTVSGPIGGLNATFWIQADGAIIDGFTVTRDGNNTTDWTNPGLNITGILIQLFNNTEVRNCKIFGNRNGIDINAATGNNIHNNIIDNNRTGVFFRNVTDNTTFQENYVTNNWTSGLFFFDQSFGSNSPNQVSLNSTFDNNHFSTNWYADIQDRQGNVGSLPAAGTNIKNIECNWFGASSAPTTSITNSAEPGYAAQIPTIFGGAAVPPPGGQPNIRGIALANLDYVSWLVNGTDNTPATVGFQPVPGSCSGTPVVLSTTQVNVLCNGGNNASIDMTIAGGTSPYTIAWSNLAVTEDISTLVAGTYSVLVTDANGTTATTSATITQPAIALSATITASTDILCFGNSTGSATVTASNGTAGYTYLWNDGATQTTATASGLIAGSYIVTVTDANLCSTTSSVVIAQPAAALSASISATTNVSCNGNANGSATVSVTGGTTAYSYLWNDGAAQTTATASGLIAGTYEVTVTDANMCSTTTSVIITQPAVLSASITATTNVLCFGDATGSATVTPTGGTIAYTYFWNTTPIQTNATATGLIAGSYTVTVTDANMCSTTTSVTITEPATAVSASITASTNVGCFGGATGSATVTGAGGTPLPGNNYYIRDSEPWQNWYPGINNNIDAMNAVFGASYTTSTFGAANPATVFTPVTQFVFLEGSESNALALNSYLIANLPLIENWVNAGGRLFLNAAPNLGGNINFGFGGVLLNNGLHNSTVNSVLPAHPIFAGPYTPVITGPYTGGSYGHAVITGGGTTPLLTGPQGNVLTEKAWGAGKVLFGGITQPYFHSPAPQAQNLWQNIISYTSAGAPGGSNYSYSWNTSPVQTAATATGLAAGTYTVTITDANNCSTTTSVTITQPATPLSASISASTNIDCFGNNTGSATVAVAGGTAPYTYLWNDGAAQTTTTATGLIAGTYEVIVTDANMCTTTTSIIISQPAAALSASISATTNVLCFGAATGTATVSASNGTAGYTYLWNDGAAQTTATASGLIAGTYTVTVTDANMCSTTTSVVITEPASGIVYGTVTTIDPVCFGFTTGEIDAPASGGTGTIEYKLNGGAYQLSSTFLNIGGSPTPGTVYTITAKDANGCTLTTTVTIFTPTIVTGSIVSQTNVSCNGLSDATATAAGAGANGGPYNFFWSPVGGSSATASGLAAGNYTVFVYEQSILCAAAVPVTITQPDALSATIAAVNVSCNGFNNGSITISPAGGYGTYEYSIDGGATWQATASYTGLIPGTYDVRLRDAAHTACAITVDPALIITQPATLTSSITAFNNISCAGGANGSITVTPVGGTTPYSYSWSPTGGNLATASGLLAGGYTVTITDANGCTTVSTQLLTQPLTAVAAAITGTTPVTCFGGSNGTATVLATGGTPGYTYNWALIGGITTNATGLSAGLYAVTVTDANSCTVITTATIIQPTVVAPSATASTITCNAGTSTITASAVGGGGTYTYSLNGGSPQLSPIFSGNIAGTYIITAIDASNCTGTTVITISQPSSVIASATSTSILCNGGVSTIIASGTGGTGTYTYSLNAGMYQAGNSFTGNLANTYTVNVQDANMCVASTIITLSEPTAIALTTSATDALCFGGSGSLSFSATGGTGVINYKVNGAPQVSPYASVAGTYTIVATDANLCTTSTIITISQPAAALALTATTTNVLCNGGTGSLNFSTSGGTGTVTYTVNGAPQVSPYTATAGTYTIVATDNNSCSTSTVVSITQPTAVALTTSVSNPVCNGSNGTLTFGATGGTGTMTYTVNGNPATSPMSAAGSVAGTTYTIVATDANMCVASTVVTVTEPTAIALTSSATDALCFGGSGSLSFSATGGTGVINYKVNGAPQVSPYASVAGTYTIVATDANLCTTSTIITISQPAAALALTATSTNVLCNGGTGSLNFSTSGGTGTVTYTVNGAPQVSPYTATAGTYTIVATDNNSCSTSTVVSITQPTAVALTTSVSNPVCNGSNGTLTFGATGGTGTMTYTVNGNPATSPMSAAGSVAGTTYTIVATDANICVASTVVTVTEPTAIALTASATDALCFGGSGSLSFSATGGTGVINYKVNGAPQVSPYASVAGTYTIVATDANLCTTSTIITISQPAAALALTATTTNVLCNGGTGSLNFSTSGGTGTVTYTVNGAPQVSPYTATAGTYTIVATDNNSCSTSTVVSITQPTAVALTTSVSNPVCNGSNGTLTFGATGGTGTMTYTVNGNPATSPMSAAGSVAGTTYTIVATDANMCVVSTVVTVTEPTAIALTASAIDASCNGGNGSLSFLATGGTGTKTYTVNGNAQVSPFSVSAGTYTLVATDANMCSVSTVLTIAQPAAIALTASATNAACFAGSGSLTFSATGGTGIINYYVNTVAQSSPFSTIAGTYTIVASDANYCSVSTVITITQPSHIAIITSSVNATCYGGNGSLTFGAIGGTGIKTFTVNGNSQSSPFTGTAGTYTIVATDANLCTQSTIVTISQPTMLTVTTSSTSILCNGGTSSISVNAIGGTPLYQYSINGGASQLSSLFNGNAAGTYTISATDANLCSASTVVTVTEPSAIALTASATNATCNGAAGSLTFSAAGGTGTMTYKVNNVAQVSPYATTAGTYTIVATDANLCSASTVLTITQPTAIALTASASNATCNGAAGSLTFSSTGGTGTTVYTVNGTTQSSPYATTAGTYTIVATDASLCSASTVLTITQPTAIALTASAANATCNGSNGSLTFSSTGGTGVKTYTVNGNAQVSPYTASAGTYTIVATDANLCSASTVVTVTEPSAIALTASATNATCNGAAGSLTFSAAGGTGTMTYKVNNVAQVSPYATTAGTYTIVATDANLCSASTVLTITQPTAIALTASASNATCNGSNGSLTFSSTGGTGTTVYTVNGTTQSSPYATTAGTYTIVATDASLCSASTVLTITQPTAIALTASAANATCNGSNGSLTFSATGGTGVKTYTVNGNAQVSPYTASAGTYTIVTTDANLCSASTVVTVTEPSVIALTASATNATCNGAAGSLTFSATGGTGTMTYKVNNVAQVSPYATTAGTYTIVAADANLCSASTVLTITQPTAIALTASASNATCNGSNGSLTFSSTGGTGTTVYTVNGTTQSSPYATTAGTYTIVATDASLCSASTVLTITQPTAIALTASAANASCNGSNGSLTFSATGGTGVKTYTVNGNAQVSPYTASAGTYTIVTTDANLCSASTVVTVTEPSVIALTASATNATCNGAAGSLTFSATGGTGTMTYKVNNVAQVSPYATTAGTYTIVATDANLCSASTVLTITQPTAIALTASASNATCNGSNGSLTFSSTGGTGTTVYTVNGTTQSSPYATTAGTYTIVATDASLCSASTVLTITQPTAIALTASAANATCNGSNGSLTFSSTGGTGVKTYTVNGNAQVSPYTASAGTYTIVATDANLCSASTVVTVTEPSAIALTASATNATCNGAAGSLTFSAAGGTGTMTYKVNNVAQVSPYATTAGTYTIVATDANLCSASTVLTITQPTAIALTASASNATCNGSNGSLTFSSTGGTGTTVYTVNGTTQSSPYATTAGTYTIVATDASLCSASTVLTITQPTAIALTASAANATCNGSNGSLTFSSTGGTGVKTYTVNGNAQVSPYTASAGTYTIVATDANLCSASTVVTVTEPSAIALTASATNATCNGAAGSLTFSAAGGTGTMTYKVNNVAQVSPYATTAGTYTIVATDANLCSASTVLTITQPTAIALTASASNATCNGSNGSLTFSSTGGTGTTVYTVNGTTQSSPYATTAGTYTIVATDASLCSASTVLSITEPTAIALTVNAVNPLCNGNNGSLNFSATGGTGTKTYTVNGVQQLSPLVVGVGTYTIVAIDANNCSVSNVQTITEPTLLVASATATTILCNGSTSTITVSGTGGSGAYMYSLNNGTYQVAASFTNQAAGIYTMTLKDANNCTSSTVITITQPSAMIVTATAGSVPCFGGTSNINVSVTGGTGSLMYSINANPAQASSTFLNISVGTFTISVTDANNCSATTLATITQLAPVVPSVTISSNTPNILCPGSPVTFTATPINGGTNPAYQWKVNNLPVAGATSSTFTTSTLTNNSTVSCIMLSNAPCANPILANSNVLTMSVAANPTITLTASTGNTICSRQKVMFTATTTNAGANPMFIWKVNGVIMATGTNSTFTAGITSTNTVVSCTVFGSGCQSLSATASINMIISAPIQPVLTISTASPSLVLPGTMVTFTSSVTNIGTGTTYQWKRNGINIPGATGTTYSTNTLPIGANTITCVITSTQACVSAATSNSVVVNVGIKPFTIEINNQESGLTNLTLYPNPFVDKINVDFTSQEEGNIYIKLLTMEGRVVKQILVKPIQGANSIQIDMTELASAEYMISIIQNGQQKYVGKVLKN